MNRAFGHLRKRQTDFPLRPFKSTVLKGLALLFKQASTNRIKFKSLAGYMKKSVAITMVLLMLVMSFPPEAVSGASTPQLSGNGHEADTYGVNSDYFSPRPDLERPGNTTGVENRESTLNKKIDAGLLNGQPVLLSFCADWCKYSHEQKSILDELEQAYGNDILFILAKETNYRAELDDWEVTGFPTIFFIVDKKTDSSYVYQKFEGFTARGTLLSSINQFGEEIYLQPEAQYQERNDTDDGTDDNVLKRADTDEDTVELFQLQDHSLMETGAESVHIAITGHGFQPSSVTVSPGQSIHWTNETAQNHTITADDELFDSEDLPPGAGFSIALAVPGAHTYTSLHGEHYHGLIQVTLPEIRGPPDAPVNDHIPSITFPPVDDRDISDHPDLAVYASRTRIMVGFTPDATVAEANTALQDAGVVILGGLPELGMILAGAPDTEDFSALDLALGTLRSNPAVRYAAMSLVIEPTVLPPRPESGVEELGWKWTLHPEGSNWGLEAARFPQAWNLLETIQRQGNTNIITGIIDKGFEKHRDLSALTIMTEISPDGTNEGTEVPNEPDFHGNHVAGIIGADFANMWEDEDWGSDPPAGDEAGRSIGISGANPQARMHGYSLSGFSGSGLPWSSYTIADKSMELFTHVLQNAPPEMKVINYSIQSASFRPDRWHKQNPGETPNDHEGWLLEFGELGCAAADVAKLAAQRGIMIVQAAGNDGNRFCRDNCDDDCCDHLIYARNMVEFAWVSHHWGTESIPGSSGFPNPILVVEAIQHDGNRWVNSNIGGDIAAPGARILSTTSSDVTKEDWYEDAGRAVKTDSGYYCTLSGTSMAAPFVTAAIGYLLAYDDTLSIEDIRHTLLTWATPPREGQSVHAAPRLNAFRSLLSLPGAARHLVDVNDMSQDGNRRMVLEMDPADNTPDTEFSPDQGFFTDPDGHVDMRDFRRFRDAYLKICMENEGVELAPDPLSIDLDGESDHPKKDLNFDGSVVIGIPDTEDSSASEIIGNRFDFNGLGIPSVGVGIPSLYHSALVPLKADGSPAANRGEAVSMTDLELFWSQWSLDPLNLDNTGLGITSAQDLLERMYSADLHIHAPLLFQEGVDRVNVEVKCADTGKKYFSSFIEDADDFRIATVPLGRADPSSRELEVRAWATKNGRTVGTLPQKVTGLRIGQDWRVDLDSRLEVEATPDHLQADGASAALITARLVKGSGDQDDYEVEGLPVTFEITPAGEGHAYLDTLETVTDAGGAATTWLHAGTEQELYTVTATVDLGDDREISADVTVSTLEEIRIHYIWQQTNLEFWQEGTTSWSDLDAPDCSSTEVADEVLWCVDHTRLELDPDYPESRLLREGVIYGWGNEYYLDEEVAGDPVHFTRSWEVSRPDGSDSDSGTWKAAFQPLDTTQYQGYALPGEVKAQITSEGIILSGLHCLSQLDYHQNSTLSGEAPPNISNISMANLSAGSTWGIYAQRFNDSFEKGAGTFFRHGLGYTEPITFKAREDGTYEPYQFCFTLDRDISRPAPLYTSSEVLGYSELYGVRNPVLAPTQTYQPGEAPLPAGQGRVRMNFALTLVATVNGEEVDIELPDCDDHEPPEADFSYHPQEPEEGKRVYFLDDSRWEPHALVSWEWDFGDGGTSNQRSPFHHYQQSGVYDVALTVTDYMGASDTIIKEVEVKNLPPTAKLNDVNTLESSEIAVVYEVSDPGPADSKNLHIRLQADTPQPIEYQDTVEAGAITTTLVYAEPVPAGQYDLTLTVTDLDGATATDNAILRVFTVEDAELTPSFSFQPEKPEVEELVFFRDHSFGRNRIDAWHWDFGDGQTSSEQEPAHRFAEAGDYPVTLTVTDSIGDAASIIQNVPVGDPPEPDPPTYSCGTLSPAECEFLHLLNAYRIQNNLPPVEYSSALTVASRRHSEDMAGHGFVEHEGSDDSTPRERATEAGYPEDTIMSENVTSALSGDAEEALYLWKISTGHHENMLDYRWRAVGLSRVQGNDGLWYWTNKFGDLLDVPAAETNSQESSDPQQSGDMVSSGNDSIYAQQVSADQGQQTAELLSFSGGEVLSSQEERVIAGDEAVNETEGYPPVPAFAIYPASPGAGNPVIFVNCSRDAGGTPVTAVLDLGDGSAQVTLSPDQIHEYIYAETEDIVVEVTATDAAGRNLSVSRFLQFGELLPSELAYYGPDSGVVGQTVWLEAALTEEGKDPWDGGISDAPVTFTLGDLSVTGTTSPAEWGGTYVYVGMELVDIEPGEYDLVISFTGNETYAPTSITVPFGVWPHRPPTARAGGPYSAYVDWPVWFDASRSWERDFPIAGYSWDFNGDGNFDVVTQDPVYEYVYPAPFDGEVRLRVTDTEGIYTEDRTRVIVVEGEPSEGLTTRVSLSSAGVEADDYSISPSLSADGRYIAFTSAATNLVEGVSNEQVYVHDRQTGETVLISQNVDGEAGTNWSWNPSISADGRYVAFSSSDSLLKQF